MIEPPHSASDEVKSDQLSGVQLAIRIHRIRFLARRYWWVIVLSVLAALAIQMYRCNQMSLHYVSTATMMLNEHLTLPQGDLFNEDYQYFFGTQVALMKSLDTKAQAIDRLKVIHPEVAVDDDAEVDAYQEPRTSLFDIRVTSTNPEYAKDLLDSVIDIYLSNKRGRSSQNTNVAVSTITDQISQAEEQKQKDSQDRIDFEKKYSIAFIEEQSNNTAAYLVSLNNDLAQLEKEHDLLTLEDHGVDPNSGRVAITPNDPGANKDQTDSQAKITQAQDQIAQLKILRDDLGTYLKDKHPKMILLNGEISNQEQFLELLKTRSNAEQEAYRKDLELKIQNLQQQIVDWNKKSLDLSANLAAYEQIQSKITDDDNLLKTLNSTIQNFGLNKALDLDDVVPFKAASLALPINPEYTRQLLLGLLGGLVAAAVLIYFIHRLDDRIDSSFDLEANIEFPLAGQVPLAARDRKSRRVPLLTEKDKRHVLVESYRNIRSSILFRATDPGRPRSVMICSAVPGEGKSTLASNLAITLALSGTRTLLIDSDMRRGLIHTLFMATVSPGLSEYLEGSVTWRNTIQRTNLANLDIMSRGKSPPHAGDLLLSGPVDMLLHESVAEYEMVLLDSAPLLAADDAANICSKLDAILFVARIGHSSIHSIRSALEILSERNARIFGLVANAVEPNQPGYYDRYRYKEYYSTSVKV